MHLSDEESLIGSSTVKGSFAPDGNHGRAQDDAKIKPFEIKFNRVSWGPDPKQPRLIWAAGSAVPELRDLRLKIYEALGKPAEARPFRPHITLARLKREDAHRLPYKHLNMPVDWPQRVGSFVLMQSHLSPHGSDYEVLAEFPIGLP